MKYISKLAHIAALCILCSANIFASGSFDKAITKFCQSNAMRKAQVGICVIDLKSGEIVGENDMNETITPASVMKIVTSATALKTLSEAYHFQTDVNYDGYIDHNGVLHGNLIIKGGVDPTMDSRHFPDQESFVTACINEIKRIGLTKIEGKIIIDESIAPDPAVPMQWDDADVVEYYGAGVHAINYLDNEFSLVVDLSGRTAAVIDTIPHLSELKIVNNVTIGGKAYSPSLSRKKNSNTLYMGGNVRRQSDPIELWTTMPHPADALYNDMVETLTYEGITVENKTIDNRGVSYPLYTHMSPALPDIIKSLLTRSDNMYAEAVLRALALNDTTLATREMAVNCERRILEDWGIDTQAVTIYDGSGLSRANSITPVFLAKVLAQMANDKAYGNLFPSLFPVAGKDGTVKKLLKGSSLQGKMALKSGSMTGVRCYAGYYPAEHPEYAVVLMTNKFRCTYDAMKKAIETLFEGMFANKER